MSALTEARATAQHQARAFVDWERFWQGTWPPIVPGDHRLYLGAQKAVYDECCRRQICDTSLAPYPELSMIGPYLRACNRGIDEPPHVDHPHLLERHPPLYFDEPIESDDLVYVDLDRAYWSIYTRTTLDVSYDGERPPRAGVITFLDADELGQHKLMRNGLLGMQRRTWRRGSDHGDMFREIVPSHRRRPDLWGLVMDCLEVIAVTARDLGCVYYHTDGAIFPHNDLAEDWIALCWERFATRATVRARGEGWVHGLSNFRIGEHTAGTEGRTGSRIDSMIRAPDHLEQALTGWLYRSTMVEAA